MEFEFYWRKKKNEKEHHIMYQMVTTAMEIKYSWAGRRGVILGRVGRKASLRLTSKLILGGGGASVKP